MLATLGLGGSSAHAARGPRGDHLRRVRSRSPTLRRAGELPEARGRGRGRAASRRARRVVPSDHRRGARRVSFHLRAGLAAGVEQREVLGLPGPHDVDRRSGREAPARPQRRVSQVRGPRSELPKLVLWDEQYGGFYWGLDDQEGLPLFYGNAKHLYGISFCIYGAAAAQAAKDEKALELARRGFRWVEEHAHDARHGGYFESLTRDGTPLHADPTAARIAEVAFVFCPSPSGSSR